MWWLLECTYTQWGKEILFKPEKWKPDKPTKIKVSLLKSISLLIYSQPVVWSVKLSKAQTEYKIFNLLLVFFPDQQSKNLSGSLISILNTKGQANQEHEMIEIIKMKKKKKIKVNWQSFSFTDWLVQAALQTNQPCPKNNLRKYPTTCVQMRYIP